MADTEDLLSITEAQRAYNITRQALYAAIRRGDLHPVTVGGRRMLLKPELEAYPAKGYEGRRPARGGLKETDTPETSGTLREATKDIEKDSDAEKDR